MSDAVQVTEKLEPRPDPEWVRGRCPVCHEVLVSTCPYVDGKGYVLTWQCWRGIQTGECSYRRVL
jgi:hypothetical protein